MQKKYVVLIRFSWLILIIAALSAATAYYIYTNTVEQQYEARSSLYVFKDTIDSRDKQVIIYNDLLASELIATDSRNIIASSALLNRTAEKIGFPIGYVTDGFAVRSGGSARIIVVTSTGLDYERAQTIVEGAVTTFLDESETYFPGVSFERLDDVIVYQVSSNVQIYMVAAAILGACIAIGCILLVSAIANPRGRMLKNSHRSDN